MLTALLLASTLGVLPGRQCVTSTSRYLRDIRSVQMCSNTVPGAPEIPLLSILPNGFSYSEGSGDALLGTLGEIVTTTRASERTCTLSNGTIVTLTDDQPCIVGNPLALFVGISVTNSLLQSAALDSGSWFGLGSLVAAPTVTANAGVAPDGTTTAERLDFPAVSGAAASRRGQFVTFTAASQDVSVYVKGVSGSGTMYLWIQDVAATTYSVACNYTDSAWTRCSVAGTTAAGSGIYLLGVDMSVSGQVAQPAQSVYVWGGQWEAGATVSGRYVPTTTTSATSVGDDATVDNPLPADGWCAAASVKPVSGSWTSSLYRGIMTIDTAFGTPDSASLYVTPAGHVLEGVVYDQLGDYRTVTGSEAFVGFAEVRVCFCASGGNLSLYVDGVLDTGAVTSGTGTGMISSAPGTIRLGNIELPINPATNVRASLRQISFGLTPDMCAVP